MCENIYFLFLYLTSFPPFFLILGINSHILHKKILSVTFVSIIWFNLKYNQSLLASNECISIKFMHYISKNEDWKKYFIVLVIFSS